MRQILSLFSLVFSLLAATNLSAQTVVERSYKVLGDCGMCEKNIEKQVLSFSGVETAEWSDETFMLTVKFDTTRTIADKFLKALADIGYDNEGFLANEDAYKALPQCCQYDRSQLENPIQNLDLQAVTVGARKSGNSVSTLTTQHVESIDGNELKKAPCCNLSESFETNGSVDVSYSDALTGAKEIQMLGLRGIYTQLMVENRPDFYGLATPYALEFIPGTWLSGIQISKGTGSVQNGMQAITGQISTDIEKPHDNDKPNVFVNLYGESVGRMEANVHLKKEFELAHTEEEADHIEKSVSTNLLLHASQMNTPQDHNGDNFLDTPLKKQLNGLWRVFSENERWCSQVNVHGLLDRRLSGQRSATNLRNPFQISADNDRLSVFGKFGYKGFEAPYKAIGSQVAATYHHINALYGKNRYNGTQRSLYANLLYSSILGNTNHKITTGASTQIDQYSEFLNDIDLSRTESLYGVFSEYTFDRPKLGADYNDLTFIAGLRADYHNRFGALVSPRLNFKYNFSETTVIRAVLGRGIRVANPIAENISWLATNRKINVARDLKPEVAWNTGVNFVKEFSIKERNLRLSTEFYHTRFENQIVLDAETDFTALSFYNLTGKSFANAFLTMVTAEVFNGFEAKLVYKFNDVRTTFLNTTALSQVPLVAKHRGLVSLDYKTPNKLWSFNLTSPLVGTQRLVNRHHLPQQYHEHAQDFSPAYALLNFSINKKMSGKLKGLEIYGGGENLTNFTQHNPIVAADNPESVYFDATQIYAPLMGRRFYMGLRFGF
jgi:outer membrane receptor for ferrienterochelin and colicins